MITGDPPDLHAALTDDPPSGYADLLASLPDAEYTAGEGWSRRAARHWPGAAASWFAVSRGTDLLAAVPLIARRRRGLVRLESSLEGTVAGPQVRADLDPELRAAVIDRLARDLAGRLGGRTGLAVLTLAGDGAEASAAGFARAGWRREEYASAVVDCRGGLEHVERTLWTNNRRNERNRGLKRGCTLHAEPHPGALAAWYPLYEAKAADWSQAPVPLAFLDALLREDPARVRFVHVRLEGAVVAGHVGFVSRRRLVAWQGAIRPDLARTHFLTTLLYWGDIVTACELGLEAVDFGGSVGRDSLWDFKRRCGAEPEPRFQVSRRSLAGAAHGWLADLARRVGARS